MPCAADGVRFRLVDHFHRRHDFEGVALRLWLLCLLVGIFSVCIAVIADITTKVIYQTRVRLCDATEPGPWRWLAWLSTGALCAFLSTVLITWVPKAAGSGLPEVKEALAGIVLFDSLSLKCLFVKPISLCLALASSLSVGKEGPFIHCASCIAYQLANASWLKISSYVREQRELEGLVAACAAGVVCTFGAPVGGVLFSAEICSTGLYSLEHLPRAFFCVTLSLSFVLLALRPLLRLIGQSDPLSLFTTSFPTHEFSALEILAFALQGVGSAFASAALLRCVRLTARLRPLLKSSVVAGILAPSVVAMLCSAVNLGLSGGDCHGTFTEGGAATLDRLFNGQRRDASASAAAPSVDPTVGGLPASFPALAALASFAVLKLFVLSPLSLSMPTPTGVFLPTFVGGAAFGLLTGDLLRLLAPAAFATTLPGHFAVTGAAAVACASTRTMSTAVVTIELTGQLSLQIPVLVATTCSYLVSRLLDTPSLFDAFVTIKGLPGATVKGVPLSADGPLAYSSLTLADAEVHIQAISLPRFISRRDLITTVRENAVRWPLSGIAFVPIVHSLAQPVLIGYCPTVLLDELIHGEEGGDGRGGAQQRATRTGYVAPPPSSRNSLIDSALALAESATAPRQGRRSGVCGSCALSQLAEPLLAQTAAAPTRKDEPAERQEAAPASTSSEEGSNGTPRASETEEDMIDLLYNDEDELRPGVDLAPLTVSKNIKLARVSYLLRTLGASSIAVTENGALVGVVTRINLFAVESELIDKQELERRSPSTARRSSARSSMVVSPISPAEKAQASPAATFKHADVGCSPLL